MSDRSYATITFYDVDPSNEAEIVAILERHGFSLQLEDGASLVDGTSWDDDQVRVGSLHEACREIVHEFPTTVFWASQDASYDGLGDVDINEPEFGYYCAETDSTGHPVLRTDMLAEAVNQGGVTTAQELLAVAASITGENNFAAIQKWSRGERKPQYVISESPSLMDATV